MQKFFKLFPLMLLFLTITSCGGNFFRKVDTRETPINAEERAKKNIQEGRGVSIGSLVGKRSTNYEFSSSNPLWRASLEILDFLPLATVDYSGGIIITDWYSDNTSKNKDQEALKITIRFLTNEIQANSLKIIVHKRKCYSGNNCEVIETNSKIKEELIKSILVKASQIEIQQKKNK